MGIIKQHIRNFVPQVFQVIKDLWDNPLLQLPLVSLIEALGKALNAEFRPFLPAIIPLVLQVFDVDVGVGPAGAGATGASAAGGDKRTNTQVKVLDTFLTFGSNIEEYLHLVIPIIVRAYERPEGSVTLRKTAIQTIDGLSKVVNFSDHTSRIIHPLVRVLDGGAGSGGNELRPAVMETLCSLVVQLGSDFAIFAPTINKVRRLAFG